MEIESEQDPAEDEFIQMAKGQSPNSKVVALTKMLAICSIDGDKAQEMVRLAEHNLAEKPEPPPPDETQSLHKMSELGTVVRKLEAEKDKLDKRIEQAEQLPEDLRSSKDHLAEKIQSAKKAHEDHTNKHYKTFRSKAEEELSELQQLRQQLAAKEQLLQEQGQQLKQLKARKGEDIQPPLLEQRAELAGARAKEEQQQQELERMARLNSSIGAPSPAQVQHLAIPAEPDPAAAARAAAEQLQATAEAEAKAAAARAEASHGSTP